MCPPPRQIPVNRLRPRFYPTAILLCAALALPAVSGGPPLVALSPRPDKFVLSWQPQPQSANFLQVSDNLLDWKYHSLTLPGSSPMRSLDFPATPGPRFFRAVSRTYAGNNPDAEDFDGDGLSTRDEILIFGTDPLVRDSDGNGVADGDGDSDMDGLPDSVEIRAGLDAYDSADAGGDLDRDGVTNLAEYQAGTDPANPDTDHDGLGDAWESLHGDPVVFSDSAADTDLDGLTSLTEYLLDTSPDLADTDGDGISDADEDADLDGVSNLQEQAAGSSPTDYYGGDSVSVTLVSGDYQAISPGETTALVTVKVARAGAAGAALANAPIFVAPTCAGTAGGAPQPGAVFRTGQDGTCSFTFEAASDALIGASPLFIGLGSLPTGESWVRVNLEIIPPAPPEETTSVAARASPLEQAAVAVSSGAARAVFPAVVKLADLPVPANTVPWKINDRGQVAYLNYNQNGLLVWNSCSLVTIPQAYPGFLYVRDLNSAGKLVGELQRLVSFQRATWAFHADIVAARLSILQPDVPDLYQSWESLSSGEWIPTRWFNALNQSTFSHIAESGTAWGVRDGFQNVSTVSTLGNRRNYQTERLAGIPAAYQTSSGAWTALPGNSQDFSKFQNDTVAIGPVGAISVPSAISPDASHWLLSTGSRSITVGNMLGSISYLTRNVTRLEARPDIGLPAQLPEAVADITDVGDIAGSSTYSTSNPYFLRNGTLIRFGAVDQVLGLANRELTEPAMVIGKKGVWLQRTDPATGLPLPLAKGANAFEYRTYQDLGASLALANLEALVVSKQGNTVILAGTNAQGLASYVTASLIPVEVVPDYNRDGMINDEDRGKVTEEKPFGFWINDDDDGNAEPHFGDIPGTQVDGEDMLVNDTRDLVDFFPVQLRIKEVLAALPSDKYTYKISHPTGAFHFIEMPDVHPDSSPLAQGAGAYLRNPTMADEAMARPMLDTAGQGAELTAEYLNAAKDGMGVLLFEAISATNESFVLVISKKSDGAEVARIPALPLEIKSVEKMYWRVNIRPAASGQAVADPVPPESPKFRASRKDRWFVFCHGYNVSEEAAKGWNAAMFKRLYHEGSDARFVGVTWEGNQGQIDLSMFHDLMFTPDYWRNVYNAFASSDALATTINGLTSGAKAKTVIAGHSLGNMLVSSAICDHGLQAGQYFMFNSAVPREAYSATYVAQDRGNMRNPDWQNYPTRLWTSDWKDLYGANDGRNKLTWQGRFGEISDKTTPYNYYSTGEDVAASSVTGGKPNLITVAVKGSGAWISQEMNKGLAIKAAVNGLATGNWLAGGGWGFNLDHYSAYRPNPLDPPGTPLQDSSSITPAQLQANPFFKPFTRLKVVNGGANLAADGTDITSAAGSAHASQYAIRAWMLAHEIPALTLPCASNSLGTIIDGKDMPTNFKSGVWVPNEKWTHSALKEKDPKQVRKLFKDMCDKGDLRKP